MRISGTYSRWILTGVAITLAACVVVARQGSRLGGPADASAGLVAQVRTALGHGNSDEARRLVEASRTSGGARDLADALVNIFEGKDDEARTKLEPLAAKAAISDAALELGLLDLRHGRRDSGMKWLNPIVNNRAFSGPDDYFRLARAAAAANEPLLANDAYNQIQTINRADVQTTQGDFLVSRHRGDLAGPCYQLAIHADPQWVAAETGFSRALEAADPKNAAAHFQVARKLAPRDPAVLLLTAHRAAEEENWTAASAALDELASVRPGSDAEFSLRAAIGYAEEQPAAIDGALARLKSINPFSALGYTMLAEAAGEKYQFDAAVAYSRKAVEANGLDPVAHFDLGLFLLRTGDEQEARASLDTSFALDKSNPTTKNLGDMLDNLSTYTVVKDGLLTYKFPSDQAAVLRLYALPLGAEAMKTFTEHYNFTPTGPILVEVFAKHDDFAVRTIGLPGIVGALGACFGRVVTMDSPAAPGDSPFSWHATLWHELAHVYSLQLSKYRVPRWLTEGISVFEEHRRNPAWGREVALDYAQALNSGKNFGLKGLPQAFKNPENYNIAYFEASLVVEHLVNLHGDAGLRTLLLAYADGATDEAAFAKAFDQTFDDADRSFRQFATQQYGALAVAMKTPPGQVAEKDIAGLKARAEAAPGSFEAQLALGQALFAAGDVTSAKPALQRAAQLAPQDRGNSSAHALLALIAEKAGDNAGARKELRALLLYDHENVEAARALAGLAASAKALDDQDYALRLVADLAPLDPAVHAPLGRREMATKQYAPALVEFQAALALGPANLAEAHADLGEAYLAIGRKADAKSEALLALKEAPTYARAQDLLLATMGKQQ